MKKRLSVVISLLVLVVAIGSFFFYKEKSRPDKIHYHAGFLVFKNNKKVNFSDWKYMNIKPCDTETGGKKLDEDEQLEKAHLHDLVGDVVHIEQEGALWKDLFINIRYRVDQDKITAFINGKKMTNYADQPINKSDSLVLFMGDNDFRKGLLQAPTKAYIELMGKKSITCGD